MTLKNINKDGTPFIQVIEPFGEAFLCWMSSCICPWSYWIYWSCCLDLYKYFIGLNK